MNVIGGHTPGRWPPAAPGTSGGVDRLPQIGDRGHRLVESLAPKSGIDSRADVKRLTACGARAILVGESLLREDDISAKVRSLGGRP